MKKTGFIILILCSALLLIDQDERFPIGIPLCEYTFKQFSHPFTPHTVSNLIYVPYDHFPEEEAINMIQHISQIHTSILVKAEEAGIKIKLFQGKLTDQAEMLTLKGKLPRGYSKADPSWDFVPGIGGGKIVYAKIGHSEMGKGHGSIALELHEFAHSLDKYVFSYVRLDPLFLAVWQEEATTLFPNHSYFHRFPEEYFAESFALYYESDESRTYLESKAPLTFEYMEQLILNIENM